MTVRPSDIESGIRKARPSVYLFRAAASYVRAHQQKSTPERAARELFGNDVVTAEVIRAASTQAAVGTPAWAGALAQQAIDDLIMTLATLSAAAGLIQRGMKTDFAGRASIRIPGRLLDANDAGQWVAEGAPIPVRNLRITSGPTLTPHKLLVLVAFTREMTEQSAIEEIARALITEATALALDKTMFGSQADDGITPGGLLNGVTPITAAPTGGSDEDLAAKDIGGLIAALVAANAGRDPVLIMNPAQATRLKLVAGPKFDTPILQSNSVADKTILAIESSSFVSAFGATPEFEVGDQMAIHMDDTALANPLMSGQPVRAMWQVDSIALRVRLRAAFAMRASGHVQAVIGTNW
jgi:HK97 family phage major capsid protein